MKITRDDLSWASAKAGLPAGAEEAIWNALQERQADRPKFDGAHVAYYAGAFLVMGAMGWFMTLAWEKWPGLALTGLSLGYATAFVLLGNWLWDRLRLRVPGGLLVTMAVGMTPLAVYGILKQFGLWPATQPGSYREFHPYVNGSWIALELATVLAGAAALRFRRFAFLTAPMAVALWYFSMDIVPILFGSGAAWWNEREWISVWFGLLILVVAYTIDLRGEFEDLSFWIYLFGLLAFWGGLSLMNSGSELGKAIYCLINLVLFGVALVLRRIMFLIFGALGVSGYLGYLAYNIFENSFFFTIALSLLGVSVIALGVIYQRNRRDVERLVAARLSPGLLRFVPPRARLVQ